MTLKISQPILGGLTIIDKHFSQNFTFSMVAEMSLFIEKRSMQLSLKGCGGEVAKNLACKLWGKL